MFIQEQPKRNLSLFDCNYCEKYSLRRCELPINEKKDCTDNRLVEIKYHRKPLTSSISQL